MGNKKQWLDAISRFETKMDEIETLADEQKKRFLELFVQRINVCFDHDENEHELTIRFRLPLVGDDYDDGDVLPGGFEQRLKIVKKTPPLNTTPP